METRVVEVREFLNDSSLLENYYEVTKLLRKLEKEISFCVSINKDDYDFINKVIYKIKLNLEKVLALLELQN